MDLIVAVAAPVHQSLTDSLEEVDLDNLGRDSLEVAGWGGLVVEACLKERSPSID